jgi:hypothetical protein
MTRVVSLYFVRHGQADHNVAADRYGDYAYWDPVYTNAKLTEKGIPILASLFHDDCCFDLGCSQHNTDFNFNKEGLNVEST